MSDTLPTVSGRMEMTHAAFQRACQVQLLHLQEIHFPDNGLVRVLCEAVRCSRECCEIAGGSESKTLIDDLRARIRQVEAQASGMRGALKFYADEKTWLDHNFPHGDYLSHATVDKGDEARKALSTDCGTSILAQLEEARWIMEHSHLRDTDWWERKDAWLSGHTSSETDGAKLVRMMPKITDPVLLDAIEECGQRNVPDATPTDTDTHQTT